MLLRSGQERIAFSRRHYHRIGAVLFPLQPLHPRREKMPLPFGLKLKRTRRYTVSSKSCLVARIQLLNNEFVEFTLSVESTGQESLEAVAQRLELREVRPPPPTPPSSQAWQKAAGFSRLA